MGGMRSEGPVNTAVRSLETWSRKKLGERPHCQRSTEAAISSWP